jgi:hypothetical protein
MKALKIIIITCYLLVAAAGFMFFYQYLFRGEFMPYHSVAVGMEWDEVARPFQVLILALMRVSGGGWLAVSVGLVIFSVLSYKNSRLRTDLAASLLGWSVLGPTLYATLFVKANSPANPPWYIAVIAIAVLTISLVLAFIRDRKLKTQALREKLPDTKNS